MYTRIQTDTHTIEKGGSEGGRRGVGGQEQQDMQSILTTLLYSLHDFTIAKPTQAVSYAH